MKPLAEQSTSELVKLHNSLVPPTKAVKRFATKDAAIRRVQVLLDAQPGSLTPREAIEKTKSAKGTSAEEKPVSAPKPATDEPAAPKKTRASTVYVEGPGGPYEYRSVAVAFKGLGLPMGRHQLFRKKLKISGTETIDCYTFHTAKA